MNVVKATSAHTETLPVPTAREIVSVLITGDSTNLVTVSHNATETIDGANTRVMWAGESAVLYSDGTNWYKLTGRTIPMVGSGAITANTCTGGGTYYKQSVTSSSIDNTAMMVNTGSGRIDIKRSGNYDISLTLFFGPASVSLMYGALYKNGSIYRDLVWLKDSGGNYPLGTGKVDLSLSSGDYLEFFVKCYGGFESTMIGGLDVHEISGW